MKIIFVIFLILYASASSVFWFLPPLFGLVFIFLLIELSRNRRYFIKFKFSWYFAIVFLLFIEQIHGFFLFSNLVCFLFFYFFIFDRLVYSIKCRICLLFIFVTIAYLGSYLVNNILAYTQNIHFLNLGYEYIIYIICESFVASILFKKRFV